MSLGPGHRLGPFAIEALVGEGGMGRVYRAVDTTLKRVVAIKVLPDSLAADSDRLARFRREAELLAALNHQNIAQIYGLERSDEGTALVLEFVDGPTLAERIALGAIPLEEARSIAQQVADALAAAHEQGIVHRDLKPANIKLRDDGTVKVLDFGLAKPLDATAAANAPSPLTHSPTMTSPLMTGVGMLLGTAAYMSPEQAKGRVVDKRADIWAFGCVLYEMLTGESPFAASDATETVALVLTKTPDLTKAPRQARRLLERCLEKDPRKRLHDIADAAFLWDADLSASVALPAARSRARWAWPAASTILAVAAAALAFVHFRETPSLPQRLRFQIPAPEGTTIGTIALSPDGRKLAFTATDKDNRASLFVHFLETGDSRRLVTVSPASPFWSPQSDYIGFVADNRVRKIRLSGGPVETICDFPSGMSLAWGAGAWNAADVIVFGSQSGPMYSVPAAGGVATPITELDQSRNELGHTGPLFLRDGRRFLYLRRSRDAARSGVFIGALDVAPADQDKQPLVRSDINPGYAPPAGGEDGGYLLFLRGDNILVAQQLERAQATPVGQPIPLAEGVATSGSSYGAFTASTGAVAFRLGGDTAASRLIWYDAKGTFAGFATEPGMYRDLSLSPDGNRIAVDYSDGGMSSDIRVLTFPRAIVQQITRNAEVDRTAVWSPDGTRLVFSSGRDGAGLLYNLFVKDAGGVGDEKPLVASSSAKYPNSWSKNGDLLFSGVTPGTRSDLFSLAVDGDRQPRPYLNGRFNESMGQFSPNGDWVAYVSDEFGRPDVLVSPYPDPTLKIPISNGGGFAPRWAHDGRKLFYLTPDSRLMAVDVVTAPAFTPGVPREIFSPNVWGGASVNGARWDVAPDGRFLFNVALENTVSQPVTVVLNWLTPSRQ